MSYQCPNFIQRPVEQWSFEIIHKNCGNCQRWLGNKCEKEDELVNERKGN